MNRTALLAAVAVVALVAAGCGSSKKSTSSTSSSSATTSAAAPSSSAAPSTSGGASLKLSADPSGAFKFNTSSLSAKAGKITITMSNPSSIQHAIAVAGASGGVGAAKKGAIVGQGGTSTVTVSLKPGTYTFYCPVDGHKQAGMKGTLTVK